jgi:hypothetical protein
MRVAHDRYVLALIVDRRRLTTASSLTAARERFGASVKRDSGADAAEADRVKCQD